MRNKALEFTEYGDSLFGALASMFPRAARRRLSIDEELRQDRFEAIRDASMAYLSACLGAPRRLEESELCPALEAARGDLANYSADGLLVPKREQVVEFNLLHRCVARALADLGIENFVDVIDLPINVRMVFGKPDAARASAPYSSSKLHSDIWAGVPVDAVVVVLPVLGDIDNITIEFGEMDREAEYAAMRTLPDYLDGRDVKMAVPYSELAMRHGHLYLSDARLLHQTVRRKREGVRVSVDFRFLWKDPFYRLLGPVRHGQEDQAHRVSYAEWLGVGSETLLVFDERMEEARRIPVRGRGPAYGADYRAVELFPAGGR